MILAHDGTSCLPCLVTSSRNVGLGINYQSNEPQTFPSLMKTWCMLLNVLLAVT